MLSSKPIKMMGHHCTDGQQEIECALSYTYVYNAGPENWVLLLLYVASNWDSESSSPRH